MGGVHAGRRIATAQDMPTNLTEDGTLCIDALQDLPEDLVKNAWRHGEYSWFPGENEVQLEMTMEPMEELDFEENVNV